MERFSITVDTTGASGDVLQAALLQLTTHGFVIERRDDQSAELAGPGLNSTRQCPLLGKPRINYSTMAKTNSLLDVAWGF